MLKRIGSIIATIIFIFGLSACQQKREPNTVLVGTIAGPETKLMQVAQAVAESVMGFM